MEPNLKYDLNGKNLKKYDSNFRILVICSTPTELKMLFELVATTSIQIQMAFTGRDGLNKALLHQPDLIILDIALPDMDGFSVCRSLKAQTSTQVTPVVFLSSTNHLDDRLMCWSLGAVDFINKPFNEHEALARIHIHLDLALLIKQLREQVSEASPAKAASDYSKQQNRPHGTAANLPSYERRRDVIVRLATAQLKKNLGAPPSPGELAQLVGTSEKVLNQAFHTAFGLPAFAWLRQERMRQARHLLTTTDTSIASIGEYLGFSTAANFSRSFREHYVMSPRDMRMAQTPAG